MAEKKQKDEVKAEAKKPKTKTGRKKSGATKKEKVMNEKLEQAKKGENHLFNLVIAVVVILGIIGLVFGYAKDKITELRTGSEVVSQEMEDQIDSLQKELATLKERAIDLEKSNMSNKEAVIDIFDKNRSLPRNVDASGWQVFDENEWSYIVSYPSDWQIVPLPEDAEADKTAEKLILQPINAEKYAEAVSFMVDYTDFATLSVDEKYNIFQKELNVIDSYDFPDGKMLYFINLDKDNKEIPTVLIFTADNIYRASFNISDKTLDNYFKYRKEFEEMVATFATVQKLDPAVSEPQSEDCPEGEECETAPAGEPESVPEDQPATE